MKLFLNGKKLGLGTEQFLEDDNGFLPVDCGSLICGSMAIGEQNHVQNDSCLLVQ